MFFGCIVKENQPFNFRKTNNIIQLSGASLNKEVDQSKVYLKLEVDDSVYNLCVLEKNVVESYKLDSFIAWGKSNKSYKLQISGGGPNAEVHVIGYIEIEETGEEHELSFNPEEKIIDLNEEPIEEYSKTKVVSKDSKNLKKQEKSAKEAKLEKDTKQEAKQTVSQQIRENKHEEANKKKQHLEKMDSFELKLKEKEKDKKVQSGETKLIEKESKLEKEEAKTNQVEEKEPEPERRFNNDKFQDNSFSDDLLNDSEVEDETIEKLLQKKRKNTREETHGQPQKLHEKKPESGNAKKGNFDGMKNKNQNQQKNNFNNFYNKNKQAKPNKSYQK